MPISSATKKAWCVYLLSIFPCSHENIQALQAMDNSHVALVAVNLDAAGFDMYRCDRPMPLGVNLNSLTKVLKCAKDDDMVTLKATDNGDTLNLIYEAKSECSCFMRTLPSN